MLTVLRWSLGGGSKSPLTASLMLAMKFVSLFFFLLVEKIRFYLHIRSLTVQDLGCYLKGSSDAKFTLQVV